VKTFTVLAAFFILAGVLYDDASALRHETMPGSQCVSTRPLDSSLTFSRIFNNSSSALNIDCPVPQENNSPYTSSTVHVIDQHYSQNVTCTHYSLNETYSHYNGWWHTKSTSGSNSMPQWLIVGNAINHTNSHYHFLACNVPAKYSGNRSGIVTYDYAVTMAR
jgi:hypothetical protein